MNDTKIVQLLEKVVETQEALAKGQESIRAEMATKVDLQNAKEVLTTKIDAMQKDITTIKANVEVGSGLSSDEENAIKARLTAVENKVSHIMRSHPL
jgi:phosphoribosylformimino-5-aminoimidazole carboxamide ribonucleotide (ProFAR) isomerase